MFKFKYKRRLVWHTHRVSGFKHSKDDDRMMLFFGDGGVKEIAQWSRCDCLLGADYFAFIHSKMESEAGQKIPVAVK